MTPRTIFAAALVLVGCGSNVDLRQNVTPDEPSSAETIVFTAEQNVDLVRDVLDRFERATCLDLQLDVSGHAVLFTDEGYSAPERTGQTSGAWPTATIRVRNDVLPGFAPIEGFVRLTLTHEVAHLLTESNAHVEGSILSERTYYPANDVISTGLLENICAVRDCGCMNAE